LWICAAVGPLCGCERLACAAADQQPSAASIANKMQTDLTRIACDDTGV
jgi:hypothetical protein